MWWLLRQLKLRWAWLAAVLFAIHPMQVETVAWASEQKHLLSTLFCLLAANCYFAFADAKVPQRRWMYYFLSLILFVLAMLSMATVVPLPVILLLVLWWRRGRIYWRDVWYVTPMFVIGLGISILFIWVTQNLHSQETDLAFTALQRGLIAGRAIWFYLGKLFWPLELLPIYVRWEITGAWWQYLYPAGVAVLLAVLTVLRRWLGVGPLVAVLVFMMLLSPALGLMSFSYMRFSFVADHFCYLASLAMLVLFVEALRLAMARLAVAAGGWRGQVAPVVVCATLLIVALAPLTWGQSCLRQNAISTWQYTVDKNPTSWMAHALLAISYFENGAYDKTLQEAEISERYNHNSAATSIKALALDRLGRPAEALPIWKDYINNGWAVPRAYVDYAHDLKLTGQYELAIHAYQDALAMDPRLIDAWNNLASIYLEHHQWPQAADAAQRCLDLQEHFYQAHGKLAWALQHMGDLDGAIRHYQRLLELHPSNVREVIYTRMQLGHCLEQLGRNDEALAQYRQIIGIVPEHQEAHKELIRMLLATGDKSGAALEQQRFQQQVQNPPR